MSSVLDVETALGRVKGSFGTLVLALYADDRSPLHMAVVRALNDFEDARTDGERTLARRSIQEAMHEFEASEARDHANPKWKLAVVRGACAAVLQGRAASVELDREALRLARTDREKAIAHNNLSDSLRAVDPEVAFEHALVAVTLQPQNEGAWNNLLLASLAKHDHVAARKILEQVALTDLTDKKNTWRAHFLAEEEYATHAATFTPLRDVLARVRRTCKEGRP